MATYSNFKNERFVSGAYASVNLVNQGDKSFKQDLQSVTEGIQASRTDLLLEARELQLAAQLLLAAESERLSKRDPKDGRAAALLSGARQAQERAQLLDEEADLSLVRVPQVRKTEALLHGRITDDSGRAAAGLSVTLMAGREAVPGVATVETDSAGYYALLLPTELAAKLDPKTPLSLQLEYSGQRVAPETAAISLGSGEVKQRDLALNADEVKRLQLRPEIKPITRDSKRAGKA